MNVPVLLADANLLTEASGVSIGLGVLLIIAVAGLVRNQVSTEGRLTTVEKGQAEEVGARKQADEAESRVRKEEVAELRQEAHRLLENLERSREASTKRHDDTAQRLGLMETREARADERTRGIEAQINRLASTVDGFDAKLDRALDRGDHPRRRSSDAA